MKFLFAFTLARPTLGMSPDGRSYMLEPGTPVFALKRDEEDYVEIMAVMPTGALAYVSDVRYEDVPTEIAFLTGASA